MKLYLVFRFGVYRNLCCGVFLDPKEAIAHAKKCHALEPDDYHGFEVFEVESGKPYLPNDDYDGPVNYFNIGMHSKK